jgi:hypothetical protein
MMAWSFAQAACIALLKWPWNRNRVHPLSPGPTESPLLLGPSRRRPGCRHVAMLTQHGIDQVPAPVDGAI